MRYVSSQLADADAHKTVHIFPHDKDPFPTSFTVQLMHDWVLVELHELPDRYRDTIYLPQGETGSNLRLGTVLGHGVGEELGDGSRVPIGISRGEVVVFHRWNMEHKQGRMFDDFLGGGAALVRGRDILLVLPEGTDGIELV